jgi:hypothetical protein
VTLTNHRNRWPIAVAADLLVVIVFAALGRSNHHESTGIHGIWHTAWPFALGTVLGLALTAWTRTDPLALRVGVRVWIWTLAIGMVVRTATGAGTAISFVIVPCSSWAGGLPSAGSAGAREPAGSAAVDGRPAPTRRSSADGGGQHP